MFVLILISLVEVVIGLGGLYCKFYFPRDISTTLTRKLEFNYGQPNYEVFSKALNYTQYNVRPIPSSPLFKIFDKSVTLFLVIFLIKSYVYF